MNNFFRKNKSLLIVGTFILVAILIRLKFHFSGNYILAGVDGPYYPLQARSMMENLHLGLSDVPLLFIIEALLARFLQFIHVGTPNECIIIAVKDTLSHTSPMPLCLNSLCASLALHFVSFCAALFLCAPLSLQCSTATHILFSVNVDIRYTL